MAVSMISIIVILFAIVVVAALVIGIAMVIFMIINGSSKPMPDPAKREEILDKLARNELSKDEAEAALLSESEGDQRRFNPACIIGVIAAVIIGALLVLGIVVNIIVGRTTAQRQAEIEAQKVLIEEIKLDSATDEVDAADNDSSASPSSDSPADKLPDSTEQNSGE